MEREENVDKRVAPVAAGPDNLENNTKAEREAQGTQDLSKDCTNRVCSLCRV